MLGLPKGEVFLCNYTVEWVHAFDKESEIILDVIGRYVSSVYHIGSTAVPGLKSKPIIDIEIELFSRRKRTAWLISTWKPRFCK